MKSEFRLPPAPDPLGTLTSSSDVTFEFIGEFNTGRRKGPSEVGGLRVVSMEDCIAYGRQCAAAALLELMVNLAKTMKESQS